MNERIKLLAEQSGFWCVNATTHHTEDVSSDRLKTFSELIVRECVSLFPYNGYIDGAVVRQAISEHFGVK
jgi:hypothetical protein